MHLKNQLTSVISNNDELFEDYSLKNDPFDHSLGMEEGKSSKESYPALLLIQRGQLDATKSPKTKNKELNLVTVII